jgi:hypothetical protein
MPCRCPPGLVHPGSSWSAKADHPRRCARHGIDLGGASPLRAGWPEPLADGNCVAAMRGGEEALRQNSELTNRNRIPGRCGGVTRPRTGKPNGQTDTTRVNPAAVERRISVLPWEISLPLRLAGAGGWQRPLMGKEKSAEAIVVRATGRRAEFDNQGAAWNHSTRMMRQQGGVEPNGIVREGLAAPRRQRRRRNRTRGVRGAVSTCDVGTEASLGADWRSTLSETALVRDPYAGWCEREAPRGVSLLDSCPHPLQPAPMPRSRIIRPDRVAPQALRLRRTPAGLRGLTRPPIRQSCFDRDNGKKCMVCHSPDHSPGLGRMVRVKPRAATAAGGLGLTRAVRP